MRLVPEVIYEGTEFRLERQLIKEAIEKSYPAITNHEVLKIIAESPWLEGEPRRIEDIVR